jgi:hypothetical protein
MISYHLSAALEKMSYNLKSIMPATDIFIGYIFVIKSFHYAEYKSVYQVSPMLPKGGGSPKFLS